MEKLMIRGEKLLLAIDVLWFLEGLAALRRSQHEVNLQWHKAFNLPRLFSITKARQVLEERFGPKYLDVLRGISTSEQCYGVWRMLRANPDLLHRDLNVTWMIYELEDDIIHNINGAGRRILRDDTHLQIRFITGIASGEITEEMLKEPTTATT